MPNLMAQLFSSSPFIPHGHCYLWQPNLVWLHLLSDAAIAVAYYSIPLTLLYFVRNRKDLPFDWIFLLFGTFIVSCGTTHLMEIWTLWHPTYWLSGMLKAFTAIISLYTAVVLVQLMPSALALPSPAQLAEVNQELQQQIISREQAEAQVHQLNQDLEAKVAQRTQELKDSMAQTKDYVERVSLAIDAAKMGLWDWDIKEQTLIWSGYHEILFGYQPGQPKRQYQEWYQRVHPEDLARVEASIQTSRETKTDYSEEYRVIWPDNSVHWVACFGRFYFTPDGEAVRMRGIVQDISDRKCVETALQMSEQRLRLATEAADIGMWFWDLVEDCLEWTIRCKTLFGFDPDAEINYERFLAALHPDDRDQTDTAVKTAIANRTEYVIEYRSVWPDGSEHWLIAKGRAFYNDRGEPIQMMGMAQDISDRKHAEINLQERTRELSQVNRLLMQTTTLVNQRNQELDQFAHIVSHDLKAPLRAISNLSVWIEDDLEDQLDGLSPDIKQNLDLLRSRVSRMEALINGLLEYARISHQETPCETFALQELLQEVLDLLNIPPSFTVEIPADLPTLTTNRLLLSQVLMNLVGNAVKHHGSDQGRVQISIQPQAEGYEFMITDNGRGIAPENHNRVFDIFQTLQSRDQKESTGVGLAIVKKIIERVGGHIQLESEVGQGTSFRFTWPMAQPTVVSQI